VAVEDDHPEDDALESREPSVQDLVELCRRLNGAGARYVVIGGFAIRAAGYDRRTMDIDLLIEVGPENERKVFEGMDHLEDHAVRTLTPGEVAEYGVVRVADEIVIDLMGSASGFDYAAARNEIAIRDVDGVPIPFASAKLLWSMKRDSMRDKDAPDRHFLRLLLGSSGEQLE
jgi:hypothetical protein